MADSDINFRAFFGFGAGWLHVNDVIDSSRATEKVINDSVVKVEVSVVLCCVIGLSVRSSAFCYDA